MADAVVEPEEESERGIAIATVGGYLALVLLPLTLLAKRSGQPLDWRVMGPALAGLLISPFWAIWCTRSRGRGGAVSWSEPDGEQRDRARMWIRWGRGGVVWGLVGIYVGYILISIVAEFFGSGGRPIFAGALPGLVVAIFSPLISRVACLLSYVRRGRDHRKRLSAEIVGRDDKTWTARMADGESVRIDRATARGSAALRRVDEGTGTKIWLEGGSPESTPGAPYRGHAPKLVDVCIVTPSDLRNRRREMIGLTAEVMPSALIPAIWGYLAHLGL